MRLPKLSLTQMIFVGMAIGLLVGWMFPGIAVELRPLSTIFIRLIKSLIAPLIFATLVVGIAGHGNLRQVGRMGVKSLLYFEVITTLALLIGLVAVNLVRPGDGVNLQVVAPAEGFAGKQQTFSEVITHIFPQSVVQAAAEGEVLQIVVFAVLFSFGVALVSEQRRAVVVQFCDALADVMFKVTGIVMRYAPIGVGAAIAVTVGHRGLSVLINLGLLILTLYGALIAFVLLVLVPVALIARIPVGRFLRAVREPASIAFSTTSSEAALPKAFQNMEAFGVPRRIVAFVLPTGYSFNLDGSTLYLALASVFVAQAAGIEMPLGTQLLMMLTLMLTSKGVAGVPRASLVILAGTLASFGLPLEGVAIILGVDEILDMGRTTLNVVGNCLASAVIARWEGELNLQGDDMTLESVLRGLAGLALMIGLAYAFSTNRAAIRWRLVIVGIVLQILFALLVLNTAAGRDVFAWISKGFVLLFGFAADGAAFVFGTLGRGPGAEGSLGFFFAFQVLPIVIFFASLMAVLYYIGIMQRVVQAFAWVMARLLGTSGAESLSVSASTFIGQTEAPLVIRPYLPLLTTSELYTIMVSGMAHIAGSVMAAYVQMLAVAYAKTTGSPVDAAQVSFAGYFLAASIMAAPGTMVVAKMLVPETDTPVTMGTVRLKIEKGYSNIIEAAAGGAGDGLRLALNIAAMLIAFIACIAVVNFLLGWAGDVSGVNAMLRARYGGPLSLELLFGFVFQFVAFAIGVPWRDAMPVGSLMGIKLVLNEFVAYLRMAETVAAGTLSPKSIIIATYALCGFANFSSIGIQIGGLSPLAENKRADIARLGLRAVLGGTIATWMIASIAGMFAQ